LAEVIEHMLEKSGLIAHYRAEKEGQDRVENLNELINAAANFMAENAAEAEGDLSGATLAVFLAHASLEAGDHQAGDSDDALQLMTVHAAKGLEFDAVFLSGLEQGLFPHENSIMEDGGLEEERRLMYVAVTRARQRLYLSHAQTRMLHGQTRYCLPSNFLEEIPPGLLKLLNTAQTVSRYAAGNSTYGGYGSSSGNYGGERRTSTYASAPSAPATRGPAGATAVASEGSVFKVGQVVEHAKFGQGVIVNAEGRGPDARVQVSFGGGNMKWLALEYAKLKAV
jgi:DNA helicase-2/ATP-dependent DNA helicase PcrA